MLKLDPIGTNDLIAIVAAATALVAFVTAFWFSGRTRNDSLRVEKSNAYLNLEMASSEVFKYEALEGPKIEGYRSVYVSDAERERLVAERDDALICYNLYFQTLNLFEVCARFRRQDVIEHEVFASWVAWFYDTLDDWYFREMWHDFRGNYTDDVRDIFDMGVVIFGTYGEHQPQSEDAEEQRDLARKRAFYLAVGAHMQCSEIIRWPKKTDMIAIAPPAAPTPLQRFLIRRGLMARPMPERLHASSLEQLPRTRAISAMAKSSAD